MLHLVEIKKFLSAAMECSVYHAPTDPGLTWQELVEAGRRAGYAEGETQDAIMSLQNNRIPSEKFTLDGTLCIHWMAFNFAVTPEYRNIAAIDCVYRELNENLRHMGKEAAGVERSVLIERAVAAGFPRKDAEVALTIGMAIRLITEKSGVMRFTHGNIYNPLPSQQRRIGSHPRSEVRENAYRIVGDIVARRTDGRSTSVEPLDAFAEALEGLGHGRFRMWWVQTVGELRRSDANEFPLSSLVLAAALVEGTLTFVVAHARKLDLGIFGSTDFGQDPKKWSLQDLVSGAARGGEHAVLDEMTRRRVDALLRTRQRIHAGRMLSEYPGPLPVPDLRPEEARDGKAVAEQVVRRVLDWLALHPPEGQT